MTLQKEAMKMLKSEKAGQFVRFAINGILSSGIHYAIYYVLLHFMPASMNNPLYNKRLQRWFEERKAEQMQHCVQLPQGIGSIPVPTLEFNVVFQLTHMMHHFFDEGIGLRQMMD